MNKVAVITGGSGGMGLATAKILGVDHTIVLADLNQSKLDNAVSELAQLGVTSHGRVCDITDLASVKALFDFSRSVGRVRAVVHTAGVSPQMGDAAFINRVNAMGTVYVARAFQEQLLEGDVLVNVASIAGHMSPSMMQPTRTFKLVDSDLPKFEFKLNESVKMLPQKSRPGAAYSTSKAFVLWYTRHLAAAYGAVGARVVSVSPGSFDTTMGRLEEKSGSGKLLEYSAIKRFGKPEEVAAVLAFAASEAAGYLTGTDILVDGGTKAGLDLKGLISMAKSQ